LDVVTSQHGALALEFADVVAPVVLLASKSGSRESEDADTGLDAVGLPALQDVKNEMQKMI